MLAELHKNERLDTIENMAADKLRTKKNLWKSYGAKSTVKCKQLMKRRVEDIASTTQGDGARKKKEIAELILGCCFRSEIEAKIERDESSG